MLAQQGSSTVLRCPLRCPRAPWGCEEGSPSLVEPPRCAPNVSTPCLHGASPASLLAAVLFTMALTTGCFTCHDVPNLRAQLVKKEFKKPNPFPSPSGLWAGTKTVGICLSKT